MKIKPFVLLISLFLVACDTGSGRLLPTRNEIVRAAEGAGATNVVVNSYVYSDQLWGNPTVNTNGGYRVTGISNIQVRVTYTGAVSNTAVETAIRQLFINNDFSGNDITVFANTTDLPLQPENTETHALPAHQTIIEAVQGFGAISVTIATYTVSGNNVPSAGTTARGNAAIVIRVNYSYNGLGTVVPSQAAVILAIRDLFVGFTNVTASVSPTAMFPLPSHSSVIAIAGEQGANNTRILGYTADGIDVDEFYYGSRQSNTPIGITITYDVGANVTLVQQAVRGLFQHFTDVGVSTMLAPPIREEIINELTKAGATSVNIVSYTIGGSNAGTGLRAINVSIRLEVNYTTLAINSNGQAAVKGLFTGFTNAAIFVGNDIPLNLPTQVQILDAARGGADIGTANINTYTINGISASALGSAASSDTIVIRIRAYTWVSTGIGWGQGFLQIVANNSAIANNARGRINQLFIGNGFNHVNNVSVIFE